MKHSEGSKYRDKKSNLKWLLLFFGCFIITSYVFAGSIVKEFVFPAYSVKVDNVDGYNLVSLEGCDLSIQKPGKPIIPFANLSVLIPPSSEITGIEILESKRTEISGEFLLYPAQEPRKISDQSEKPFILPDQVTYQLTSEYPSQTTEIIPSGNKSEYRIGGVFLYPLKYIPAEKKLILYERIKIRINYEEGRYDIGTLTENQKRLFSTDVKDLVINPENIHLFSPRTRASDNPDVDYVILTNTTLETKFAPIVNWLRKTGVWADTFNTTWVYANYTGYDRQEKIRKFIFDYYTNHGTKYVLLVGDTSVIPARGAYAIVNTAPATIDSFIPCDLYYFDLQYSWDGNNNHIYGDTWLISGKRDTVDLYYDVYGGRWPFETSAEVDTIIRKFMTYVKNPDTLYEKRILLPYGFLWSGYDAGKTQDSIANYTPVGWTDRYIRDTRDVSEVRDSLNNGFGFCHLVGHGNEQGVYWTSSGPEMYVTYSYAPSSQTNYNKLVIANSNACISGNFEYSDCLAEEMLKARGSAIGVMMNSRYGWGYTTQIGPSELLDVRFYNYLFSRDSARLANCHQASKQYYRSSAISDLCWRWCYYELNLFGEPQMMMWKDNPKKMIVRFSNPTYTGSQSFAVACSSQGSPLSGAIVSLWKGSEVYAKGTTNASGQASLSINPASLGYMYVTVTAKNNIPYEDSCSVVYLKDVGVTTIENPSSAIDSTGPIIPRVRVENFGSSAATYNITLKIGAYTSTRTSKTIGIGVNDTVNFSQWIPIRGTHTICCSIYLSGDLVPANDTLSGSVTVSVTNVGVTAIENPLGTFDSIGLIVPRAKIKNYGSQAETLNVKFRIGSIYIETRSKVLGAGVEDTVNFPSWVPIRGTYQQKCSTYLTGDVQYSNDTMSNSITVHVKNVGVTQITTPSGSIDSSGPITPTVSVKNYGTDSAFFDVILKIGAGYTQTRTKTLSPGIEDTVNFLEWQPTRGSFATRCSVYLLNDAVSSNDTISGSVMVNVHNVGISEIIQPKGNVDSAALITPKAKVKNFGSVAEIFNVRFIISTLTKTSWISDTTVTVNADDSLEVSFVPWTEISRGGYLTRCSTYLANDMVSGNNVISDSFRIQVRDYAATLVTEPYNPVDSGTVTQPKAIIHNYGSTDETDIPITLYIVGTSYSSVKNVSLNAGDSIEKTFDGFTANVARGNYTMRCTTQLNNDLVTDNNLATREFAIRIADVSVIEITQPTDTIDSIATFTPIARVKNFGTHAENFNVAFTINSSKWSSTKEVSDLDSGAEQLVEFDPWTIGTRGDYTATCFTLLANDMYPENDTLVNEFIVITDTIPPGAPTLVTPQANTYDNTPEFIWNYTADADSFNLLITGLSKDEINIMTADTTYIPVDPLANGTYYWKVRAEDNVGNLGDFSDSLVFTILPPDIPTLVLPLDNDTSNNQLPQFIWNFSNDADSFNIVYTGPTKDEISVMTIDTTFTVADSLIEGNYTWKVRAKDEYGFYGNFSVERTFTLDLTPPSVPILVSPSNGATITTESQCLIWNTSSEAVLFNLVAGGVDVNLTDTAYTIEFGRGSYTWKVRAQDAFGNWSLFCDIWGFTVQIPDWTQRESIPAALDVKPGKYVKSGGAMVAVNTDLYAFYGNKSKYFYKYNTGTKGSWTVMESIPYGVKSTDPTRINKKTPNKGSALCWDNNNTIFATKGNTNEFWAYYIDTDTWLQKAFVPVPKKYKGGTSITFYDGKIYLLAGNQKTSDPTNFYSYDPTADTAGGEPWISLSSAPFTPNNKKWKDGSAITVVSNIIYALKGGDKYNVFCAYDVLVGSWVEIESIPRVHPMLGKKTKVKDGGAIAGSGTVLYAIKGGGKQDLWLYTPGTPGVWTPLETIPRLHKKSVPKTGAALAYASNGKLFLLKGNNTLELWKYIPAGMLDAKTQISNANTNMQIEHTLRQIPGDKLIELVPNPFAKHAVIHYSVPVSGRISIKLYNISGRCFETLVDNYQTAGNYTLGIDNQSSKISKGVYFLKYEFMGNALSERAVQTMKIVIE